MVFESKLFRVVLCWKFKLKVYLNEVRMVDNSSVCLLLSFY